MNWSLVIAMVVVIVVSAAIRLAFYVWWRERFGGRPVRRKRGKSDKDRRETQVIEWEQLERRDGPS